MMTSGRHQFKLADCWHESWFRKIIRWKNLTPGRGSCSGSPEIDVNSFEIAICFAPLGKLLVLLYAILGLRRCNGDCVVFCANSLLSSEMLMFEIHFYKKHYALIANFRNSSLAILIVLAGSLAFLSGCKKEKTAAAGPPEVEVFEVVQKDVPNG
jgi:hypothetical protein